MFETNYMLKFTKDSLKEEKLDIEYIDVKYSKYSVGLVLKTTLENLN